MVMATVHASPAKTLPGEPYPLDASFDGSGTNFSVFSEVAERVELCYVDWRREPVRDDDFLVLFNAGPEDVFFRPFLSEADRPWQIVLNTSTRIEDGEAGEKQTKETQVKAEGRSIVVMSRPRK